MPVRYQHQGQITRRHLDLNLALSAGHETLLARPVRYFQSNSQWYNFQQITQLITFQSLVALLD